ncbi:MAG: RlmE family RNA methyltransferase [Proteobacteria bacterium]|nr:RlmE family RNA methyltransferase [Pseudomonadota bacterium]
MGRRRKPDYTGGEARSRQAREQGYAARSVFKLEEIDKRTSLLKRGQKVLDLGACPGSWSQYALKRIGPNGLLVAIDLQDIGVSLPGATVLQGDAFELDVDQLPEDVPPFDVVLSDMAPKTTGVPLADHVNSVELCDHALTLAKCWLRPGGHFVCKVFTGEDEPALRKRVQAEFSKLRTIKPKGTRSNSRETFLVGLGKR